MYLLEVYMVHSKVIGNEISVTTQSTLVAKPRQSSDILYYYHIIVSPHFRLGQISLHLISCVRSASHRSRRIVWIEQQEASAHFWEAFCPGNLEAAALPWPRTRLLPNEPTVSIIHQREPWKTVLHYVQRHVNRSRLRGRKTLWNVIPLDLCPPLLLEKAHT